MMFMKKRLSKFLSILFVLSLVISLFCGGKSGFTVKAARESKLNEKSKMKLESVVDKSNGDQVIYPWSATENPTVTYGDTLHVKLSWEFADGFIFDTTDVFTYQLPDEITFNDIPSTPIYDGTNKVGTFVIENNVIKINYTSATFCGQSKRHGSLTFSGSIIDDGKGKTPEKDMEIHFPGLVSINVHMKPSDIVSNLDIQKRHEEIDLVCKYSPEEYPNYNNYNAIDVGRVQDIPFDFEGIMGVPDTIFGQFNPNQFEIVGLGSGTLGQSIGVGGIPKEHKRLMKGHSAAGDLYYLVNGVPKVPYSRILIRNKYPRKL